MTIIYCQQECPLANNELNILEILLLLTAPSTVANGTTRTSS